MKKSFYSSCSAWLVALLLAATTAAAQNFPNNGLDTWSSPNGVEKPTNWQTTDDILNSLTGTPAGTFNTGAVTKITDVHGGTYAAKLTTVAVPTTSGGSLPFPGYLVLGNRVQVTTAGDVFAGLPYTSRPTQLQFYYKLSGSGAATDQAGLQVVLTRAGQVVGEATATLTTAASTYTLVTLPLQYSSSQLPDSITVFAASGTAQQLQVGTTLQLDDISLTGGAPLAVRADASLQELLTVAPNPSPAGRFVVSSPSRPELADAPLAVFDVTGRTVLRQPAQAVPTGTRELNLSTLPLGIYTLRLDSKQGTLVRQLVVK